MKRIIINVEDVRNMYLEEKKTYREIAKELGVSTSPISIIIKRFGVARKNQIIRDKKKYITERIKVDDNGCWNYPHSVNVKGYSRIQGNYAHRVSYELFKSKIPEGLTIDHLCKNKICINPEHLEAVTGVENVRRSDAAPSINARKTHCIRGHLLSGNNLKMSQGKRQCRTCVNKSQLFRYHKNKKLKRGA